MASENVPAWAMEKARAIWPKRVGGIEEMFDRVLTVEDLARVIAEERAAIVAWLRTEKPAEVWHQAVGGTCYTTAADAIDRGDTRAFMDRALASAHAAGEEKGRREMRAEFVRLVKAEHVHALRFDTSGVGATVRLHDATAALPTTPPTPNPLPATGGEEEPKC